MPSASYTGYSIRSKAGALWKGSVAPRIGSAAVGLSRGIQDLRERREWDAPRTGPSVGGSALPPRGGVSGPATLSGSGVRELKSPTREFSTSSSISKEAGEEGGGGGWVSGLTSYFGGGNSAPLPPAEEKVVCFPGWAVLRPSIHSASEPALVVQVLAHGYAYSLRPLSQASRSQRIFYSLAKSFAALPKVPAHLGGLDSAMTSVDSLASALPATVSGEGGEGGKGKAGLQGEATAKDDLFAQLLDIGSKVEEPEEMERKVKEEVLIHPEHPEDHRAVVSSGVVPKESPPILDSPAKVSRKAKIGRNGSSASLASLGGSSGGGTRSGTSTPGHITPPTRQHPAKASSFPNPRSSKPPPPPIPTKPNDLKKTATTPGHSRSSTLSSSESGSVPPTPTRSATSGTSSTSSSAIPAKSSAIPNPHGFPLPFSFVEADLPRLHSNLQSRLLAFFGLKLSLRKIRITIYPSLPSGSLVDKPLATKVVTTTPSGAFKTHLDIRSKALRRLLDESGDSLGPQGLSGLRVKVVCELLEDDKVGDLLGGGAFTGHQGLKVMSEDECELDVGSDGGVRVISDIDDTIKWTEVLGGTKTIFRNVFVRELADISVPGMAHWYNAMAACGARFHYVSNMPWELWGVTREFVKIHNFPPGSATLKEYGGASSAIAKLWEDPGSRKRAGVETILKDFPECRFILIGDSGEQDMNLYVSLAQQYPDQVMAIYIRDVTTPFKPDAHPKNLGGGGGASRILPPASIIHSDGPGPILASEPAAPPRPRVKDDGYDFSTVDETPGLPGEYTESPVSSPLATPASLTSTRPKPPRRRSTLDPEALTDDEGSFDPLSPNNPLRPEPPPPTANETKATLIEGFYARIRECEKILPEGTKLRIFRHGRECEKEGVELVKSYRTDFR